MSATIAQKSLLPFSTASDGSVQQLLKEYQIGLTVEEAKQITTFLGRDPTLTEAVIWGIQGSEHCSYKSSRRFLKNFPTNNKHIILGPVEDSGIVAITDGPKGKRWGFVVTHESHNHPSQIVPFEGAATGIGGTVRDVLCMGARVIGCLDMLRLGDLKTEGSKTIAKEVVRGIGGYGNPLGVPNFGGDIYFDKSYNDNCLVNAIALGIVREDEIIHSYAPAEAGEVGYDIILVGKPTDRSGFGGAAFASADMEEDKREQNSGAVQEPNPFLERHLLASFYALFDWLAAEGKLDKLSCKDLGAGGVVCASVEQIDAQGFGAVVDLDKVHVGLAGLPPEVIACSETQERFCITCHPDLTDHIVKHFNKTWDLPSVAANAKASVIGKVNTTGTFELLSGGKLVCQARAKDMTCGLQYKRPTKLEPSKFQEPEIEASGDSLTVVGQTFKVADVFRSMLTHLNGCSRRPAFLHYDKTVIGNSIIESGEGDAGVLAPLHDLQSHVHDGKHPDWDYLNEADKWLGVAVSADGNGRYGRIDPYLQGVNAAVEAMRNVAAVGATPRALTDCLNYGNPEIPEQLAALEAGVKGIADAANGVSIEGEPVAVISGNVSLYNSQPDGSSIDPTAIVSCIGVMADARQAVDMRLKEPDCTLYLVGERLPEFGGSLFYDVLEELTASERDSLLGSSVPQPNFGQVKQQINFVTEAISHNLVSASHDVSDGGLAMALFEMTLPQRMVGGDIGLKIDLGELNIPVHQSLFSETGGFVLAISNKHQAAWSTLVKAHQIAATPLGTSTSESKLIITMGEQLLINEPLKGLHLAWSSALANSW